MSQVYPQLENDETRIKIAVGLIEEFPSVRQELIKLLVLSYDEEIKEFQRA